MHPHRLAICVGLGLCFWKGDPENNRDLNVQRAMQMGEGHRQSSTLVHITEVLFWPA